MSRHLKVPPIPKHVRQFCEGELAEYHLLKKAWIEAREEMMRIYEEGGDRGYDKDVVQGGKFVPEQQRTLERIESIQKSYDAVVAERRCQKIEATMMLLNREEQEVLERTYWKRESPVSIQHNMGMSESTQRRVRKRIVYYLAIQWRIL